MSVVLRDASAARERTTPSDAPAPAAAALDAAAALGRLCHEARSPITPIVGFCDIMLEEASGRSAPTRYREYIRDIKKSGAEVMSRLVEATELAEVMTGTAAPVARPRQPERGRNAFASTGQQDAASTARVVIRTALSSGLSADPRRRRGGQIDGRSTCSATPSRPPRRAGR